MNSAWDVKSLYFRMDGEEKQIASDGASYPSPPVSDAEAIERTRKRITEDGFISYITSAGKVARFDLLGMGVPEIYAKKSRDTPAPARGGKRIPGPGKRLGRAPKPVEELKQRRVLYVTDSEWKTFLMPAMEAIEKRRQESPA